MMMGLEEVTNLKIHWRKGVEWIFGGSRGRLKVH